MNDNQIYPFQHIADYYWNMWLKWPSSRFKQLAARYYLWSDQP